VELLHVLAETVDAAGRSSRGATMPFNRSVFVVASPSGCRFAVRTPGITRHEFKSYQILPFRYLAQYSIVLSNQ
jgi:hypothetical protein